MSRTALAETGDIDGATRTLARAWEKTWQPKRDPRRSSIPSRSTNRAKAGFTPGGSRS